MRQRIRIFELIVLTLTSVCLLFMTGCLNSSGNSTESDSSESAIGNYVFSGLNAIRINESEKSYDFGEGVTCKDENGDTCEFTVDSSGVSFGKAGKYSVVYKCGGSSERREVYIYGKPTAVVVNGEIPYENIVSGDLDGYVIALDSFGETLVAELKYGANYNENGAVLTGEQEITVTATDEYGNESEETVEVTVLQSTDYFDIVIPNIDYAKAFYIADIGGREINSVYTGGVEIPRSAYIINGDTVGLTTTFFRSVGVGANKEVWFNFATCSVKAVFSVTDDQPVNYVANGDIDGEEYYFDEPIRLTEISLSTQSAQDVEFKKYIETNGEKTLYSGKIFEPFASGEYSYIVDIYKNGELSETKTQTFTVDSTCYYLGNFARAEYLSEIWTVSGEGELSEHYFESGKTYAIEYYKPNADGTQATALNNALYLKPEFIAGAKSAGYTRLQFSFKTEKDPADVDDSAAFVLYKEKDGKTIGTYLKYRNDANTAWTPVSVNLSEMSDGEGLKLVNYGKTLYVSDLTFKGKDYGITNFNANFSSEEYLNYIWERNNADASEITCEEVTKNGVTFTVLKFVKDDEKSVVSGAYEGSQNNSLYISESLISSALAAGRTKLTFWYATEAYSTGGSSRGAFVCYKYSQGVSAQYGSTGYALYDNTAYQGFKKATIDISDFTEGDTLKFNCYGSTMYLAFMTFADETGADDPYAEDIFEDIEE